MRILGIDPGYDRCGVAIVEHDSATKKSTLVYSTCVTPQASDLAMRIQTVADDLRTFISTHAPDVVAIEKLFFSKNKKTALSVAEARGVILGVVTEAKLPIFEYSPQEIKLAITGHGASSKEQVAAMVKQLVAIEKTIAHDDEFDAIATALTHGVTNRDLR